MTESPTADRSVEECNELLELAQEAYIWGSPLVQFGDFRRAHDFMLLPKNRHFGRLAVIEDDFAPSQELLYSFIIWDLSVEPQLLSMPPIPDRYYSVQFMDSFFNPFAYISTRTAGSEGGLYAIVGPDWAGELPTGAVRIDCPASRILTYIRTGVKNKADSANAVAIAEQYKTSPLSQFPEGFKGHFKGRVGFSHEWFPVWRGDTESIRFFDKLSTELAITPLSPGEAAVAKRFERIHVGPGLWPSESTDKQLRSILKKAIPLAQSAIDKGPSNFEANRWEGVLNFGPAVTDYRVRAAAQSLGGGYNVSEESVNYRLYTGPDGEPLSGVKRYRLFFPAGGLPPVDAFWSICALDEKGIPVPNPINRHAISSGMTDIVYGTDGSLEIVMSSEDPKTATANWLPIPNDGQFNLFLRTYLPDEDLQTGRYVPPAVQLTD